MQSSLGLDLVNGYQVTCFTKLQGNHVPRLAQCVDPDLPSATQTPRTEAQEIMQRAAQAFNAYKILQNAALSLGPVLIGEVWLIKAQQCLASLGQTICLSHGRERAQDHPWALPSQFFHEI